MKEFEKETEKKVTIVFEITGAPPERFERRWTRNRSG